MSSVTCRVVESGLKLWFTIDVQDPDLAMEALHTTTRMWVEEFVQGRPFILDDFGVKASRPGKESWNETYARTTGIPHRFVRVGKGSRILLACRSSDILAKHEDANWDTWTSGLRIHVFTSMEDMMQQLVEWGEQPDHQVDLHATQAQATLELLADGDCLAILVDQPFRDHWLQQSQETAEKLKLTWVQP